MWRSHGEIGGTGKCVRRISIAARLRGSGFFSDFEKQVHHPNPDPTTSNPRSPQRQTPTDSEADPNPRSAIKGLLQLHARGVAPWKTWKRDQDANTPSASALVDPSISFWLSEVNQPPIANYYYLGGQCRNMSAFFLQHPHSHRLLKHDTAPPRYQSIHHGITNGTRRWIPIRDRKLQRRLVGRGKNITRGQRRKIHGQHRSAKNNAENRDT